MSCVRFGVILDDLSALKGARPDDPVDIVVVREFFRNPARLAGCRSVVEKIQKAHPKTAVLPYAWHYITHAHRDGIAETNRRPDGDVHEAGHFKDTKVVNHAWSVSESTMQGLGSNAIVFRTPPSFAPGSLNRKRFMSFLERHRKPQHQLIWEPQGLWEQAEADEFAAELGVIRLAEFSLANLEHAQLAPTWFCLPQWESTHTLRDVLWELQSDNDEDDEDGDDEDGDGESAGPMLTILVSGPKAYGRIRSIHKDMGT